MNYHLIIEVYIGAEFNLQRIILAFITGLRECIEQSRIRSNGSNKFCDLIFVSKIKLSLELLSRHVFRTFQFCLQHLLSQSDVISNLVLYTFSKINNSSLFCTHLYAPFQHSEHFFQCNVMTSLELARRLVSKKSTVTSNVMNPGLIPTTGNISYFFIFLYFLYFFFFFFFI